MLGTALNQTSFLEDKNTGDATRVLSVLPRTITTERDTFREIVEKDLIVLLWITIDGARESMNCSDSTLSPFSMARMVSPVSSRKVHTLYACPARSASTVGPHARDNSSDVIPIRTPPYPTPS